MSATHWPLSRVFQFCQRYQAPICFHTASPGGMHAFDVRSSCRSKNYQPNCYRVHAELWSYWSRTHNPDLLLLYMITRSLLCSIRIVATFACNSYRFVTLIESLIDAEQWNIYVKSQLYSANYSTALPVPQPSMA